MTVVEVVQVSIHKIVGVIAMRDRFVTATRAVLVAGVMGAALMALGTLLRIRRRHAQLVLVDVLAVHAVQVAVMKIIDVISMFDARVAATRTVLVRMVLVSNVFLCHTSSF